MTPTNQFTKPELHEILDRQATIISKELRCNVFLPFGLDLLNFKIVYTKNVPKGAPAATNFETIFINPESEMFTRDSNLNKDQVLTFLFNHEDFHRMLFHDKRIGKRDQDLWNIAGDFVVNLLLSKLEQESKDQCPSKPLVDMQMRTMSNQVLYSDKFEGMIEEEVYEYLKKNGHFKKKTTTMTMSEFLSKVGEPGDEKGDQESKGSQSGDVKITEVDFKMNGKEFHHVSIDFPKMNFSSKKEEEDFEERRTMSRQILENNLSKGIKSVELKKFLGKLFNVKVDWAKITRDSLMTAFEKSHELTWGKPRMTWMANPSLPFLPSMDEEERYGIAVFAIDESGSMSDNDVLKAAGIMMQAKDYYKGLLVIKHDSDVGWTRYYEDFSEVNVDELAIRRHCGGTSHEGVFNYVTEFLKTNPDDMISVFLGCTDLCSDVETTQQLMDIRIPRIYLVNHDQYKNRADIIGKIIKVD